MDLGTIIGLTVGFILQFVTIILSGNPMSLFISVSSFVGVVFGSLFAMMMASPLKRMKEIIKWIKIAGNNIENNKQQLITQLVEFATNARRHGILSLDDAVNDLEDEFLSLGLRLAVDGAEPEVIDAVLLGKIDQIDARHQTGISFFENWASCAPAFGMIGTLLGLIGLLANLDDPASLGPNMSLALITTLYGTMFANMVFTPIAQKLSDKNDDELLMKEIMLQGIRAIQAGDNPRVLDQKLYSLVSAEDRPASIE